MKLIMSILASAALALPASAENRFPQPQFESGYTMLTTQNPAARDGLLEVLDVAVLFAALSLTAWLALIRRSRRGVFLLMLFSLIYFGFWRKGCVCSVGSLQNITMWFFDSQYVLPLSVAAFFILPLVFALLFGRVFCAAVCPLGSIQDAVVLVPVRLPAMLTRALTLMPYIYLGFAVLLAATGAGYIVCRLDPFVGFFRLSGEPGMIVAGAIFLLIGIFVARPYCRFLCPYGVLLGWMSGLSKWHSSITPDECVKCRLCENACPFDAILKPNAGEMREARPAGMKRLVRLLILLPVLMVAGGWAGSRLDVALAEYHRTVRLEQSIEQVAAGGEVPQEVEAFRGTGVSSATVHADAAALVTKSRRGGWIVGAFLGAVFGFRLIGLSIRRKREDYMPDRAACLSCARCFLSCPRERMRLKEGCRPPLKFPSSDHMALGGECGADRAERIARDHGPSAALARVDAYAYTAPTAPPCIRAMLPRSRSGARGLAQPDPHHACPGLPAEVYSRRLGVAAAGPAGMLRLLSFPFFSSLLRRSVSPVERDCVLKKQTKRKWSG